MSVHSVKAKRCHGSNYKWWTKWFNIKCGNNWNCDNSTDLSRCNAYTKAESGPPPAATEEPNDLPFGKHYTQSHTKKLQSHSNRIPRKASSGIKYGEPEEIDIPIKKRKPVSIKPQASGPFETHVTAQKTKSRHPSRRLPPFPLTVKEMTQMTSLNHLYTNAQHVLLNHPVAEMPRPKALSQLRVIPCASLKKLGNTIVGCAKQVVNSARELVDHHQTVHGIVYCPIKHSTTRSPWLATITHTREKQFQCTKCDESFTNFSSELKTHNITHQCHAKHLCAFPKCGKLFKNKPDLTRHADTHTAKPMKCLDCSYSSKDKRNFESHWLKHSKFERYFCKVCGKGFVFNTQMRRHVAKKACQAPR